MKEIQVTSTFKVYEDVSKLTNIEQSVMSKAVKMLDSVYAPYSGFHVGAAVMTAENNVYGGCNQENASYPLCICGERVALYNAGANEPKSPIKLLAIVSHNPKKFIDRPVSPCGACRQVISEFATRHGQDFPVLLKGDGDMVYKLESCKDLLPFGFDSNYL
jgi:cytidine deaminase